MSQNRDHIDNESQSSVHNLRGIDLAERGWIDEAISEFKRAIKNAPSIAQGHDNLASAFAEKGELLDALKAYTKAIELEPENPIALHNLGCFLSNHASRLAYRCFKNALAQDPELNEARFNLGLCLAAEDQHEKAIEHFEMALANSDDNETRLELANSLIALGKHKLAIMELLKVVRADKNHDQAWFSLGQSYTEQGFLEEAEKSFSRAILINARHIEAVLSLASLLSRLNRGKEAKPLIRRAASIDQKRTAEFIAQDEYLCHEAHTFSKRYK